MAQLNTIVKLIKSGNKKRIGKAIALNISMSRYSHFIPDRLYIRLLYRFYFGKKLNLRNPVTFNEKLQWIKLYERKPIYTQMVDKYWAKDYAAQRIGKEHIVKTYGVWDKFDDIDFDILPNQFVLKCTHDSGSIIICKDKNNLNMESTKKKLELGLATESFYYGREWPYKNVKPRIIAEELLVDTDSNDLKDYKFFCFNGHVKCLKIDFERFINHRANYYDRNCKLLPFGEDECPPDFGIKLSIPKNLYQMIVYAEKLAQGTSFLRVDFYNIAGKIFFGEMTFFPASGFGTFTDENWDKKMGDWLMLDTN